MTRATTRTTTSSQTGTRTKCTIPSMTDTLRGPVRILKISLAAKRGQTGITKRTPIKLKRIQGTVSINLGGITGARTRIIMSPHINQLIMMVSIETDPEVGRTVAAPAIRETDAGLLTTRETQEIEVSLKHLIDLVPAEAVQAENIESEAQA